MKKIKILSLFLLLSVAGLVVAAPLTQMPQPALVLYGGGGGMVVIEDILMLTGSGGKDISSISILDSQNGEMYSQDGCYENECSVDVSGWPEGIYTVSCSLSGGGSFSGTFSL